ncbi:MAG: ChaN family lipoprotein [Bryobacterales bacterium]|nr:ChaN family lipoprotein [Bryobacterales bacterium]
MRIVWLIFTLLGMAAAVAGGEPHRVFLGNGEASTLEALMEEARAAEVVFIGESHDDPTAHALERDILDRLTASGPVVLSLEMFETDVQQVLDEYLAGWITEDHLQKAGRAWKNYNTDYRPMVELAKQRGVPVVAANAPRRYVNRVTREGPQSLQQLPAAAKHWLPPLPYAEANQDYAAKFLALMQRAKEQPAADRKIDPAKLLAAQSLWDASMAYSIALARMRHPGARVLHVNGSFHSEGRLGILHHLERYRPSTRNLVVTVTSAKSFPEWDDDLRGAGDFVILTDPALPRSFSVTPAPEKTNAPVSDNPAIKPAESK